MLCILVAQVASKLQKVQKLDKGGIPPVLDTTKPQKKIGGVHVDSFLPIHLYPRSPLVRSAKTPLPKYRKDPKIKKKQSTGGVQVDTSPVSQGYG